jgi:PD-(D/E)XK nuclease superfamily
MRELPIKERIRLLIEDEALLKRLLATEKKRRGVPKDRLLFIGASDVAGQCWCSMQAVLRVREEELGRFGQYLYNRLHYAHKLGLLLGWPTNPMALLGIGEWIAFEQVDEIEMAEQEPQTETRASAEHDIRNIDDYDEMCRWERGYIMESLHAERYPRFSWHFPWDRYIVVGIPDGITKAFIYEFKSTGKAYFRQNQRRVGSVQADLYGLFFRRNRKRVQVYSIDTGEIDTIDEAVDKTNAERFLRNFSRVDGGEFPRLPDAFKCRICDYANRCPLRNKHGLATAEK